MAKRDMAGRKEPEGDKGDSALASYILLVLMLAIGGFALWFWPHKESDPPDPALVKAVAQRAAERDADVRASARSELERLRADNDAAKSSAGQEAPGEDAVNARSAAEDAEAALESKDTGE